MTASPAVALAVPVVASRRHLSFAELASRIDIADLSAVAKRDLKSALKRVASWLGETLETAPADPARLRKQMAGWTGPRFGVSAASFSVVLSQLRRALRFGEPVRTVERAGPLKPQWQRLADAVRDYWTEYRRAQGAAPGQNWLALRLARFFRWCDAAGIEPEQVDDAVIAAYIDAVAATALRGDPAEKERGLRKAWNYARTNIARWPAVAVATRRTPLAKPVVSLPEDRFPRSLVAELDAYRAHRGFLRPREVADPALTHLERLRRQAMTVDVSTATGGRHRRLEALAPASCYWHRRVLVMTASALVARGVKPIEAIRSIADVATPEGAACVVDSYEARRPASDEPSTYPTQLVTALLSIIARCGIILAAPDRRVLNELAAGLAAEGGGRDDTISPKNRTRLAQFDDPDSFALLVSCSEQEMDRLEVERRAGGGVSTAMARRAEAAIGNLLLCSLPVRRRTLATTDRQRNFLMPTRRGGPATLIYHPDQTKTRRALQVVLDPWRWRLVELYWRHYRPHLAGAQRSSFLFPGETAAGHKSYGKLASAVTTFVAKRTGLQMNLHLWRHLMGAKLLEEHEDVRLVEELLGHVPGSRATRRYVELKTAWAAKRLDRITDEVRDRGRHLHRRLERRGDRRRVAK